ncbi:YwqG family protein [Tenacibaculum sp. 190130A14a]
MKIENLDELIHQSSLKLHEDYIKKLVKPCLEIVQTNIEIKLGSSKLGGIPDLPINFEWPAHTYGNYRFVAQFNLGEIPQGFPYLPKKGLLSIFIADDEDGNYFWGDDGYAKVFLFENIEGLSSPTNLNVPLQSVTSISFKSTIDIPLREELYENNPLNEEELEELIYGTIEENEKEYNYMFGYPFFSTLAYNPIPDKNWIPFLTLSSIDNLDWNWHDGDYLMLFIEEEKLQQGDFSYIKSDAG